MTSTVQVTRLLTLVPYLQARGWVDVVDVADDFGINKQQLIRDLEILVMCGLPGGLPDDLIEIDLEVVRDEGVVNLRNAPDLKPLRFTTDEATSLIVAIEAVREIADSATAEVAKRVLDKLLALVGQPAQVSIEVSAGDDAIRDQLNSAIKESARLQLTYDGLARRQTTQPVVDPYRIEIRDGVSYLVAWAVEREDWRRYRLDRIAEVKSTGQSASPHLPPIITTGWFDEVASQNIVELELDAEAVWITEYYPTMGVEPLDDGGAKVSLLVSDPGWLTGLLLRLGPHLRSVKPADAAVNALAEAKAALKIE